MHHFILYHAHCSDGFCAATVAAAHHEKLGESYTLVPVLPGFARQRDAFERLKSQVPESYRVISFDVPYEQAGFDLLLVTFPSAEVYDHHKSTAEKCKPHPQFHYDVSRSGAGLAWDYYHPDKIGDYPPLVAYVQDTDLWTFKLEDSRKISTWLYNVLTPDLSQLDDWLTKLKSDDWLETARRLGGAMMLYRDNLVKMVADAAVKKTVDGHAVLLVESTTLVSEVGQALYERKAENGAFACDYAMIWRYNATRGCCVVSLRSNSASPTSADVSLVASTRGGGGHRSAAGFECSMDELLALYA